jgi:hypothetical protein
MLRDNSGLRHFFMTGISQIRKPLIFGMVAALWLGLASHAWAGAEPSPGLSPGTALDRGFAGLYNLDFEDAQKDFSTWETQHPDDPVGPVSQAAGFLFSEFNRLGVLEGQFYENDEAFTARSKLSPDPVIHGNFQNAIDRAQQLAHARLTKDPRIGMRCLR